MAAVELDEDTRKAIREGMEQAERGEFVPDAEIARVVETTRSMKVRYTSRACDELIAILDYVDQRSPTGAKNVKRALHAKHRVCPGTTIHDRSRLLPSDPQAT
jgi:hypothetical protein